MNVYPKVKSVRVLKGMKLEVIFEDCTKKIYDCSNLIQRGPLAQLKSLALFKNVHVDPGGYGISWNDGIDLSESELWVHGENTKLPQSKKNRSRSHDITIAKRRLSDAKFVSAKKFNKYLLKRGIQF